MYFYKKEDGSIVSCYKPLSGLVEITEKTFNEHMNSTTAKLEKMDILNEKTRPLTDKEVTAMLIKQQINTLEVDDTTALRMMAFYPEWLTGKSYAIGDRVQHMGTLYKCAQAHTSKADWTPEATPALWVTVSVEEWPDWVQPTGAHDAYNKGDKVSYNGKHYICTIDANAYAPGVSGWEETVK